MNEKIMKHYKKQAEKHKDSGLSTIDDRNIREKEVNTITSIIYELLSKREEPRILDLGCGNGYTLEKIHSTLKIGNLVGVDPCVEFIDIAKQRNLSGVEFEIGDATDLEFENDSFDIVFTERCIINLLSWEEQKQALDEIYRVLNDDGIYIMIESFTDGLSNMDEARNEVCLYSIGQPFHNRYLDKEEFYEYVKDKYLIDNKYYSNFLSSYYYGSRILYPIISNGNVKFNSKFVEFFKYFPPYGNYSCIQLYVLLKGDVMKNTTAQMCNIYPCITSINNKILLDSNSVVFDCGAHVGVFAKDVIKKINPHVYVYESNQTLYNKLKSRYSSDKVIVSNEALDTEIGEKNFFISDNDQSSTLEKNRRNVTDKFYKVKTTTLQNEMDKYNLDGIDYLKLNIEGTEMKIIMNTPVETLRKVKQMAVMYHQGKGIVSYNRDMKEKMISHLKEIGFRQVNRFRKNGDLFMREDIFNAT